MPIEMHAHKNEAKNRLHPINIFHMYSFQLYVFLIRAWMCIVPYNLFTIVQTFQLIFRM